MMVANRDEEWANLPGAIPHTVHTYPDRLTGGEVGGARVVGSGQRRHCAIQWLRRER